MVNGNPSNIDVNPSYTTSQIQMKSTDHSQPPMSLNKNENHTSASFLKDLEAELELPPMTPVTDEKEEAVRALSATLSKYMRQGSCGSDIQRSYDTTSRSHSRTFTPSDHSRTISADP